jgi:hypothetical protein
MADSALSSILTTFFNRPQFTATNEGSRAVLWKGLAIVDVEINPAANITQMPLSADLDKDSDTTEKIKVDDVKTIKILQPIKLRVSALIGDLSVLENIVSTFKNETVTISVNTKSIITNDLIMTDLEITQSEDMVSASRVEMTFEQSESPRGDTYSPEQSADASTNGIGAKNPISISGGLSSLKNTISGAVDRVPVTLFGPLLNNKGSAFILDHVKNGMLA